MFLMTSAEYENPPLPPQPFAMSHPPVQASLITSSDQECSLQWELLVTQSKRLDDRNVLLWRQHVEPET